LCGSSQDTTLGSDEILSPVLILMNITPQSSPSQQDESNSPSEPRRLELDDKSKGSPAPTSTPRSGQEEDILHEDQEDSDTPGSPILVADRMLDKV
jgi:hypothetical protein